MSLLEFSRCQATRSSPVTAVVAMTVPTVLMRQLSIRRQMANKGGPAPSRPLATGQVMVRAEPPEQS
jgi:hypothetical protein